MVGTVAGVVPVTVADGRAPDPPAPSPLSLVLQQVVLGDLVVAGGSNLVPDGARRSAADVDDEVGTICVERGDGAPPLCDDNSTSATLDLPPGASVLAARLYVSASLGDSVGPLRVRLAGPGDAAYSELGPDGSSAAYVGELRDDGRRQAIWDVTDMVRQRGGGEYTVADIVSEAARPELPAAAWTIVAAYDLGVELGTLPPEHQGRFARRALSWHDGFATTLGGAVDVEVGGFAVPTDRAVFAKLVHLVTHRAVDGFENVLFGGDPIGNNLTPGDAPPPAGVVLGADPACNSTVDVLNHSTCALGTPTGPAASTVDLDVVRIPDRYLVPASTSAVVSVVSDADVAVGVLAVSVDQPARGPAR